MTEKRKSPVVIDLEATSKQTKKKSKPEVTVKAKVRVGAKDAAQNNPAFAPTVPEETSMVAPQGEAMQSATRFLARKRGFLSRLFVWAVGLLLGAVVTVAFWDFVTNLMARNVYFGWALTVLVGITLFCLIIFALREIMAFARLRRIDGLRLQAMELASSEILTEHQVFAKTLLRFYRGRADMEWARASFNERATDVLDATTLSNLTETTLMDPLDKAARIEIETASRQVATGTALVPLALADIVIALTVNVRMIRRIAEIYGGRTGTFGSWRLLRSVAVHLVATGAVAIGDDMLGSIAGGSIVGKLSRRFGEGVVNGALTARVGVAAMDVCRPMPFRALGKPRVTELMKRALTGFFARQT